MDRMSRLFAALRVALVAMTVCLLGAATRVEHGGPETITTSDAGASAHADNIDPPDPCPVVAEQRDEDPRGGVGDDGVAHGPHTSLLWHTATGPRIHPIRGPPRAVVDAPWRPRSARAPPQQV